MSPPLALLHDIGSTYTKVACVDLESGDLIGWSRALTTIRDNVMSGVRQAVVKLGSPARDLVASASLRLACSSAAGGLNLVALGRTAELTAAAAREACLGAGAKVRLILAGKLGAADTRAIAAAAPDIILLAGGADGGDSDCVLHNARQLAAMRDGHCPVVYAGNRDAAGDAQAILRAAGRECLIVDNVYPDADRHETAAARAAIRDLFGAHIVQARGLHALQREMDAEIIPTPLAVMTGCQRLADGVGTDHPGIGELMAVDVGGATTDVHSIARGRTHRLYIHHEGADEPRAKRTVEGDLGVRINAPTVCRSCRRYITRWLEDHGMTAASWDRCRDYADRVHARVGDLPRDEAERLFEWALAAACVAEATSRHVGRLEPLSNGAFLLHGKDLAAVQHVIGIGGVLADPECARRTLPAAGAPGSGPRVLKPTEATYYADRDYVLWAAGLLSDFAPRAALHLARNSLMPLPTPDRLSGR